MPGIHAVGFKTTSEFGTSTMYSETQSSSGYPMDPSHCQRLAIEIPKARISIVDGDAASSEGTRALLTSGDHDVKCFADAVEYLAHPPHNGPACLVLSADLQGGSGLQLQQRLVADGRAEVIIFVTENVDLPTAVRAVQRGAIDFLLKPLCRDKLLDAVVRALQRSTTQWRERTEVEAIRARLEELTPRERDVLHLIVGGYLNKQIAAELGTALRTVKRHRSSLMRKLGVVSVAALVLTAQKAGCISCESVAPRGHMQN
jgi:FixJ family two-component response regulator